MISTPARSQAARGGGRWHSRVAPLRGSRPQGNGPQVAAQAQSRIL